MEIVAEIANESRSLGYEIGFRGCLGGSLIVYILGATDLNPLPANLAKGYDIPCETFWGLSGEKRLDIELDICENAIESLKKLLPKNPEKYNAIIKLIPNYRLSWLNELKQTSTKILPREYVSDSYLLRRLPEIVEEYNKQLIGHGLEGFNEKKIMQNT